jgi:hypothetical protein
MHVVTATAVVYTALGERVYLSVSTGGRGILPLLPLLLPAVVFVVLLLPRFGRPLAVLANRELLVFWGPYFVLTFFLTLSAIVFMDYPVRTAFDVVRLVAVPLSLLLVGLTVGRSSEGRRILVSYVMWFLVLEAGYAVVVQLARVGILNIPMLDPILAWDLATQTAYQDYYALVGRAIGTYINPNMLGFLSVLGFWFFWFFSKGPTRLLNMSLMMLLLVATISRGSMIALAGSAGVVLARELVIAYRDVRIRREVVLVPATLIGVGLIGLVTIYQIPQGRLALERFVIFFEVLSRGAEASSSLLNRIDALRHAFATMPLYPLGTMGSPEFTLQSFVDNEFVRVALQGGAVYLLSYFLALWGGLRNLLSADPWRACLAASSIVVAIMALTAQPLTYVAAGLYWIIVGAALATGPAVQPA